MCSRPVPSRSQLLHDAGMGRSSAPAPSASPPPLGFTSKPMAPDSVTKRPPPIPMSTTWPAK
uniref:Uncharacterized protein n=1 Tax=Pseudomonas phage PACT201 TaxID=3230130 RepID=A0AAU8GVL5_9VIRU